MPKLTEQSGNPANALAATYQELMAIDCPRTLADRARAAVAGGGFSPRNRQKFETVLRRETNLDRIRQYLTNFLLAADGLAVLG